MHRGTPHQRTARIHDIFVMLCEGKSTATIYSVISEKYGIKESTVKISIKAAAMKMKEMLEIDKEEQLSKALAIREHLVEKLISVGSFAAAAQCLADANKLQNLYSEPDEDKQLTPPQIHLHKVATQEELKQLKLLGSNDS